jgi:hypothetical protein
MQPIYLGMTTDKVQLTGQNLGQIFNFRKGDGRAMNFICYGEKLPMIMIGKKVLSHKYLSEID